MDILGSLGLWATVLLISLIGVITKLVYYKIGVEGREAILDHIPRIEPERLDAIRQRYEEGGSGVLLLTSIPGLGSAIAASAGLFRTPLATFVVLVYVSNLIRNSLIVIIVGQGVQLVSGS